jgi:hypothetical protein
LTTYSPTDTMTSRFFDDRSQRREEPAVENQDQQVLDPPTTAQAPDPEALRSLLEKKTKELEKDDVGVWTAGICGPI